MARERFDLDLVDPNAPFELDMNNVPHLVKHFPFTHQDALDAWFFGEPVFFPAAEDGEADWLMVAEVAGHGLVVVPLAPSSSGDPRRCRPIGIYQPSADLAESYRKEVSP